jgi:malonyl-CoA/methylmalonyl-CoA synthetase
MNANLYDIFAERFPQDRTACCIETGCGRHYSWDDMERGSARIANLLASLDLPRNARVAVQVDKSPEAVMLYLATLRAGLVYLPLNTAYRAAEIEYFLNDAEPSVVVCSPANFDWVQPLAASAGTRHVHTLDELRNGVNRGTLLDHAAAQPDRFETVQRQADDLAAILYTSGTTGRSKGAMLTHGNLSSNALVLRETWQWQPDDVLLHALPLFHIHGLFVACNGALVNGSKMIFLSKFDSAEVLRHLPQATVFMGVPTYYTRLLEEPGFNRHVCARMRLFISGSAPLLAATFTAFRERSGQSILERYGMSETAMQTSNPYDGPRLPGSVGKPLPGVTIRIANAEGHACAVDEIGGIEVRGPNVFKGYWRMPEKTAEEFTADGYFRTGDVGRLDANGYLWIVGRSKDLIISGGYNVYPKEVEAVIDDLDGVLESAVIGVPHADFGEAVFAVVVPEAGAGDAVAEAAIIASLKEKIANFKVPKRVVFVDELPRNTMGKVQKNVLRSRFG